MIYCSKNYNDLIKKCAQLVKAFSNQPTIVFCEDKITLSVEMEITALCGGSLFCEVSTLNRFMQRISSLKEVCSKQTISLIIKKLLSENNENLKTFKNLNSYSLAGAIAELIAQLKSAKVSPQELEKSADSFEGVFNYKICDIALIYKEYENYLEQNNLLDTNNKFSLFVDKIKDFNIEKYNIIIAGFQSVTAQTAMLFKELNKRAKRLDFLVLQGQENLFVNETYNFAKDLPLQVAPISNESHERYYILDNLFSLGEKTRLYSDKIRVFSYITEEDEIIDIAKQIKQKVINGAKWEDFMVVCSDLEKSKNFIKKTFLDYEIPYFLEDTFNLSSHPLIRAICDYIDLSVKRFDIENYKRVLRHTSLFSNASFVNEYIEFLTTNSYSAKSFLNGIDEQSENVLEYKNFREFTLSLPKFYLEDKSENFVDKILTLLQQTSAKENLEILAEKLKAENLLEQAEFILNGYEYINKILQETNIVLSQDKITAKEFKALLLSSATYTELSVIPQKGNRVYLGDFNNCKYRFSKNLYVIGLNSNVPNTMADTSILTNSDLKRLDKIKVIIEPKLDIVNARNKENVGVCLSNFTDSLTLSYSTMVGGKDSLPSEILEEVCSLFALPNGVALQILKKKEVENYYLLNGLEEQKLALKGLNYLSKQVALKNFAIELSNYKYTSSIKDDFSSLYYASLKDEVFKELLDEIISRTNSELAYKINGAGELFFNDKKVSASAIEKFYSCPYAHFLERGLGVSENDKGQLTVLNLGTLLHSVYEDFVKRLAKGEEFSENDLEDISNQLINQLISQDEYKKFTKQAIYENLFLLLKQEVKSVLLTLVSDSKKSSFKPKYFEYSFGFDSSQKGIKIKTKHGDYEVRGKIDRIDFCDDFVRIIDYKTGKTTDFENLAKLFNGSKLQLYLYLNIFLEQKLLEKKPKLAGVYYAPMNNEYLKNGESKAKSLKGKTINDEEVLIKTDCTYKQGSTIIDVEVDKKGELKINNVLSEKTLEALCKYARLITAKAIEQIKEDCAIISPTCDGCKYCKFLGICGFAKEKFDTTRKDIAITEEQITKIAEEENE